MEQDAENKFGAHIKRLRQNRKMSCRELAQLAGMNSGSLARLEHGGVKTPGLKTLKCLATALEIPPSDLYTVAGYNLPYDAPGISSYLRTYYGYLPEEKITAIDSYIEKILDEYDDEYELRRGPLPGEDEFGESPTN